MIEPVPPEQEAANILRGLKEDSATGPDLLPTKMLRECADVLAKPFRMLALLILQQGAWPEAWMMHWIVPLFKKVQFSNREIIEGYISQRRFRKPWSASWGPWW